MRPTPDYLLVLGPECELLWAANSNGIRPTRKGKFCGGRCSVLPTTSQYDGTPTQIVFYWLLDPKKETKSSKILRDGELLPKARFKIELGRREGEGGEAQKTIKEDLIKLVFGSVYDRS